MSLRPEGYRSRLIENKVRESLRSFGGVCIEGPKWCGKTWLGLTSSNSAFMVGGTNEYGVSNRAAAELNVYSAIRGDAPHLIDEWQDVPGIWDAVRSEIDKRSEKGLFILTGSSNPKTQKPVHSGTGRIRHIRMRTMSLYESGDSSGTVSLKTIMSGDPIDFIQAPVSLEHLVDLTMGGGWPGNIGIPFEDKITSVNGYLESIIRDASQYDGVRRKESNLWMVMRSLARNECTLASNKKIHNDTGVPLGEDIPLILSKSMPDSIGEISYDTVSDYLDIFDRLFLIDNQIAFDPNLKSSVRVGKVSKRHLVDPALAIAALGASKERLMKDLNAFGFFFESLCERDLRIYAETMGAGLFHYRDDSGREVDAIVELPDGRWGAFEIKLGANQIEDAAKNLLDFRKSLEKHGASRIPDVLCVICGLTEYSYLRNDGVYVVAVTVLGP